MPEHDWNERYRAGDTPWDDGQPEARLVELVLRGELEPCRVLEAGCGTGTNAVWLAERGFDVVGCDLSPLALERATARAADAGVTVPFHARNLLEDEVPGAPFELVFDRGVFHVFDAAEDRARFAAAVASALGPGGRWLTLAGSTEGPARDHGPPRRTVRDLAEAIEPELEMVWMRATSFAADLPSPAAAWFSLWRRRAVAAQPSTGS